MAKCKICKGTFEKRTPLQTVCGLKCAQEYAKQAVEKKKKSVDKIDRIETKKRLAELKTLPQYKKEAQIEFNRYIRARDIKSGFGCICCGRPIGDLNSSNNCDAGHYRSVGSAPHLRFNEDNCHAQLKYCNNYLAGNHVNYRIGLIERIGIDRVEALESNNEIRKYAKEELIEIKKHYLAKRKELENGKA